MLDQKQVLALESEAHNYAISAQNILRGSEMPVYHYDIFLYVLFLKKEDIILEAIDSESLKDEILHFSVGFMDHYEEEYEVLGNYMEGKVEVLPPKVVEEMIALVKSLSDRFFVNESFQTFFEAAYKSFSRSNSYVVYDAPVEIFELLTSIIDTPKGSIYCPFAGMGGGAVHFSQDDTFIYSQEANQERFMIGLMRQLASYKEGGKFLQEDSVSNWLHDQKFDMIFSTPPMDLRLGKSQFNQEYGSRATDYTLVRSLQSLSDNGKAILLLPASITSSLNLKSFRQSIIEDGVLEYVISFPSGLIPKSGVRTVLLIIDKSRNSTKPPCFVDAQKYMTKGSGLKKRLDAVSLANEICEGTDTSVIKQASYGEIASNQFDLTPERYLLESVQGVPLGDILFRIEPVYMPFVTSLHVVSPKHLLSEITEFELEFKNLPRMTSNIPHDTNILTKSSLVLQLRGGDLKPTYVRYQETPYGVSSHLAYYDVDGDKVDIPYLVNELRKDYVTKQIKAYSTGSTQLFLTRKSLMDIKVKLPSLQEQKAKTEALLGIADALKELKVEFTKAASEIQVEEFNEYASLKHSLGAPRQNILSYTTSIINFLKKKNDLSFHEIDSLYKEKYPVSLIEALESIKDSILYLGRILDAGEKGLILALVTRSFKHILRK